MPNFDAYRLIYFPKSPNKEQAALLEGKYKRANRDVHCFRNWTAECLLGDKREGSGVSNWSIVIKRASYNFELACLLPIGYEVVAKLARTIAREREKGRDRLRWWVSIGLYVTNRLVGYVRWT